MCMMKVVVLREMLGARETGWTLWSGKDVMEMTSRDIKKSIENGEKICGLTIGTDGELVCDEEGFYCTNILEHRHCGNYKPMLEDNYMTNLLYICISKTEENGVAVYDCISTRFEQLKISESDMKAYLKIGIVSAGAKLDEQGNVVVASLKKEAGKEQELTIETLAPAESTEETKTESTVVPKLEEKPAVEEKPVAIKKVINRAELEKKMAEKDKKEA